MVIPFLNVLTYRYSVVDPSTVDPDPGFWSKMLKIALVEKNSLQLDLLKKLYKTNGFPKKCLAHLVSER